MGRPTGTRYVVRWLSVLVARPLTDYTVLAMSAAQTRIAETIETFYGAADRSSDGAMASHAYKRSVDDMDGGFQRELVSHFAVRDMVLYL